MIDRKSIIAWSEQFPWSEPSMVEQDLLISRALVAIFSDEFLASQLAFRGGTALHKLYLSPQPRYSEDIDLVQISDLKGWQCAAAPIYKIDGIPDNILIDPQGKITDRALRGKELQSRLQEIFGE